jgi:hypothetical protein
MKEQTDWANPPELCDAENICKMNANLEVVSKGYLLKYSASEHDLSQLQSYETRQGSYYKFHPNVIHNLLTFSQ